ncbi:MAG: PAS domain S-box protein [Deltaproteobacteria bacterium]|nr:MAG: PAS domain S-box protein [Deltaproteobacteria bacterium]
MAKKPTYKELAQRVKELEKEAAKRKDAEEALRKSEQRYRNLIESAPFGIHTYRLEEDGRLVFTGANPAADRILGVDNTQFVGQTIDEAFPPLTETEVPESYRRIAEQGATWQTEHINYEDQQIKGAFVVHAFQTSPGNMAAAFIDIFERKQMEQRLREKEEKFRKLAELLPETIFEMDAAGTLTFVNQKALDQFGYSPKEFKAGLSGFDMIAPVDRQRALENATRVMKGEKIGLSEYHALRKDGSTFPVILRSSAITRNSKPVGLRGVIIDISERKRLEEQLHQALKMESIGTLAGGIAHDFNNLLLGIQGRTSLMLKDIDSSDPKFEHLIGIEDSVESAAILTKQILGFARGGKYENKPTDLNVLLDNSADMFGRTKKEITIHKNFDQKLWTAEIDQGQIKQVLLNIFVNAWQAMPHGGTLYIQTENVVLDESFVKPHRVKPGRYVQVSITDTGIGMNDETLQKVFDPFFTTKEKERGTGLGLASAYGIIKNHDGLITADSQKGQGAIFKIYLPASDKVAVEERESAKRIMTGTETVLLVDDEEIVVSVGQQMLKKLGYAVLTASGGKKALDVYKNNKNKINIVILDMVMPNMGGSETFDRLREVNPAIKILLSSGYSITGQAALIIARGCNGFIQKPFDLKTLSQKIREILDGD